MQKATIRSRCECQAALVAEIDEKHQILTAHAETHDGEIVAAPANKLGAKKDHFDVGWQCSLCGRNVLRSFYAGALLYRDAG